MNKITVGVLTISDRCASGEAVDESGPALVRLIGEGIVKNGTLLKTGLVPDSREDIERVVKQWCCEDICLVLTTGGTGVSERDVTPEATAAVLEKSVPGIPLLMFQHSSAVTPFASLSRGVAGVRGRSLIINLPGSKKASQECLKAVAGVIPHAVDLIRGRQENVETVHMGLKKKSLVAADREPLRQSPYPCISVKSAQEIIAKMVVELVKSESVNYKKAVGQVLAQDVIAKDDLPPFHTSLKDGYAVRTVVCSETRKLKRFSSGEVLEAGSCVRVNTGGPIPPGTDAVVQVEDTELRFLNDESTEEVYVHLLQGPVKGRDIRSKGSDFKKGEELVKMGTYVCPAVAGVLAAAGMTSVKVFSKPKVAVMSTGNEVVRPEEDLGPEKVRDSNRIVLLSLLKEENFEAVDLGIIPDEPDLLRDSLEKGFRAADVVVSTGSMSMGERDYMNEIIISDFNGQICFGRVFMKPGKPTAFGTLTFEGKPKFWFGLPGNPASAFVTAHLFLLPALREISKQKNAFPRELFGVSGLSEINLGSESCQSDERPHYVRGILSFSVSEQCFKGSILPAQKSSWIGSCVSSNCLILFSRINGPLKSSVFPIGKVNFID